MVTQTLTGAGFRVTRTASTGGLLRRGVTTLLIGLEDEKVEVAVQTLRTVCATEGQVEKRACVFVVPVESFEQL
jgi:uncharacterized protein YaaQ